MYCFLNGTCPLPTTGNAPRIFSSAFQFFVAAQCLINPKPLPKVKLCNCEKFDFIVIGAGTAGCVVANRLTENKDVSVLLIEAGGEPPVESRITALSMDIYRTKYDWNYLTTDDGRTNKANFNGSIAWTRGKMLGGSSSINIMSYVKGRRYEYEEWYNAGNEDWHPDVVQEYFNKAENYQYQALLQNSAIYAEYGHNGPLVINRFNFTLVDSPETYVDSYAELGFPAVIDINIPGGQTRSISGIAPCTAANGIRQSSDIAYIYPIRDRPNLKVLKNTLATKILIDKRSNAYGVEATHNKRRLIVHANNEVILSAGAINSPQLLMLSGVGPKEHLESKDIVTKVDSSQVGLNLQDHVTIPITIFGNGPEGMDEATQHSNEIMYLYNRSGYLAGNVASNAMTFYSLSEDSTYIQYQIQVSKINKDNSRSTASMFKEQLRYKEPIPSSLAKLNQNNTLYFFLFHLLHPESRGNISLRTCDPHDHPLIYPNYFLNQNDLDSAVAGIKMLTQIVNTQYFRSIEAFLGRMDWPECNEFVLDSDDYWGCVCINMVSTTFHPVGTCKMGPDPNTSVVDSHLRVHGVGNLRVVDASIMPILTSGNTNGPTFMIAERASDLIKQDHEEIF